MALISPKSRREIGKYARQLADLLGLRDWTINLMHEFADDTADASILTVYGQKVANVYLAEDWESFSPERQRSVMIHELLHCHINAVREPVDHIQDIVGTMVYQPLFNSVTQRLEFAVDGITLAIAQYYPLPKRTNGTVTATVPRTRTQKHDPDPEPTDV